MSNRLYKCFEATQRDWNSTIVPGDEFLANDGRIMDSMLSEHMCEGWLEAICSLDVTVSSQAMRLSSE